MGKSDRKNKRLETLGLMSFISDGKSSVLGIVEDLSATGLRVGQVPLDFDDSVQQCKAVVHSPTGDFNMILMPRWIEETNRGMYKSIGFQITAPPDGWIEFVAELPPFGSAAAEFALVPEILPTKLRAPIQ